MAKPTNVIPFDAKRRKSKVDKIAAAKAKIFGTKKAPSIEDKVVNLAEIRQEKSDADKRAVTRTVLSQFLGVFVVLPHKGLQPISLYDVSEVGLSFDLDLEAGSYNVSDNATMRIYLSHDTYFSFHVRIANRRTSDSEGTTRHGAVFRKDDESFKTLFYFTKFLENVSQVAKKDSGDRLLGRID